MQARKVTILADQSGRPSTGRRRGVVGALVGTSLLGVVAATAVPPGVTQAPISTESVIERLGPIAAAPAESNLPFVFDERVLPGDTIQAIFRRIGANDQEVLDYLNQPQGLQAQRQLRAGRSVLAVVHPDGTLASLSLPIAGGDTRFTIERTASGIKTQTTEPADLNVAIEMRTGTIRQTLFGATDTAGIPDSVATKLAEIFGTEIDFSSDLRRGDRFSVVYESMHEQGIPVRAGRILAAEFINDGKRHAVVLHRDEDGADTYFTPEGRGLSQAFLRYPLEFSRISSNFGGRMHPIHKRWKAHKGTDFAAATGTPVKAASNGVVEFAGGQNGYGNVVVIQHRDGYESAYAHLNGFARGLRKGQRVRQGDVIGYVGSTGWATGAHLHFEIRVNGIARDPMKIALPTTQPLGGNALAAFRRETTPLLERLALLNRTTVARAN
ncbi:peptidoglycan DD-metalloendopeptidase family protein [Aromatoleum toluvorans]|uniref:Peptidoglycan DD-metalloendopeptidase family protein n=2 Tax=Aromatoleum toluvorans TaxID=92002 RepID=A0ABX1Q3U5_9RHOO|nr:M23 family metallopeptidase [Aromatoleum toluvorans]NMG46369.1 peptidoglycan DD-metalloendopeptidase family protein [Aromatoleum toluvorans]